MFKKAKKKIVLVILTILASVIVGTLVLIYLSSYISITTNNYRTLEAHVQMLQEENKRENDMGVPRNTEPIPDIQPGEGIHQGKIKRDLQLNTFYTVALSDDGSWKVVENDANEIYSDEELITIAAKVLGNGRGHAQNLLYCVSDINGETVVCFMDNARITDSFNNLFLFTLLFGILALLVIAVISVRIANHIVAPMEENYLKQKQFTADAGHELKTPIAAMAANIEILQRELGANKWLDNISYENDRMRVLVNELLELARNENKTVERNSTDLSNLVNGAILPLEATAFEKNVLIESEIDDEIIANVEENSIRQLVTILVDNAVSHTTHEKDELQKIFVKLCMIDNQPVLSVSNPGEEIPKEEREKLFERFYRSDQSHEFSGHYGLGLAIAKAIVDANEAKISIDCQNNMVIFEVVFS